MRYWKRAIEITVELGCTVMNSEFNGRPEQARRSARRSSGGRWRSCCRSSSGRASQLRARAAPRRLRRGRQGRRRHGPRHQLAAGVVPVLRAAHVPPGRRHAPGSCEYAGDLLTHLHVADSFDHRASSGLRYIVNPPGSTARVHQHLDIGQGEVDWDEFFGTLGRLGFGCDETIMTVCVFAWEERARESSLFMREEIGRRTKGWG